MIYTTLHIIRRLICWIDFILATLLLYALSYLPKKFTISWYPKLFRKWCWMFVRALDVNLKLHQKNQYPLPKHYMLIGNHPSAFEDAGMPALFDVRFLAKIELREWFILGRISDSAGTLYVKRESKESRTEAGIAIQEALNKGINVGLYPEGGCKGRRIHTPFQFGCFDIAIKTNTMILPVFLHYESQESFEWGPNENLIQKLKTIATAPNRTANYYVFDAIDPSKFENKATLCRHVELLYLEWQKKYLE